MSNGRNEIISKENEVLTQYLEIMWKNAAEKKDNNASWKRTWLEEEIEWEKVKKDREREKEKEWEEIPNWKLSLLSSSFIVQYFFLTINFFPCNFLALFTVS